MGPMPARRLGIDPFRDRINKKLCSDVTREDRATVIGKYVDRGDARKTPRCPSHIPPSLTPRSAMN